MNTEEYKKTLSNGALHAFESIEKNVIDGIERAENEVKALESLAFFPKKDGTEKANFGLNFGLIEPFCEKFTINWGSCSEVRRRVTVEKDFITYSNTVSSFKLRFSPEREKTPYKSYVEVIIYTGNKDFDEWAGFDTRSKDNQDKMNAKFLFDAVKSYYLPKQVERLNRYKKELEDLPKWFDKILRLSKECKDFVESTGETTFIHSFAYRNFVNRDLYYI